MGTFSKNKNFGIIDTVEVIRLADARYEEELTMFQNAKAGTPHKGMPSYKKILKQARAEMVAKKKQKPVAAKGDKK